MKEEKIKEVIFFIILYVVAITLIEYTGELMLDFAGDMAGALILIGLGINWAIEED